VSILPIINEKAFDKREYQENIYKTALEKNTLVVLPTGMGKTLVAVMVGAERLDSLGGKILIMAPTRPLNAQHTKSFEKFTFIGKGDIKLITGRIKPENRAKIYKEATIIAATPQCIKNDLEKGRLDLSEFYFAVFDEAHRAVKDYAYTYVAKKYMMQSDNPLILALTASPGGKKERIQEVINNLFIESVEIRSESDEDVKDYVQDVEKEFVYVDFPEEYERIKSLLKECYQESVDWLKSKHYLFTDKPSKTMLINLQKRVGKNYSKGNKSYGNMWALMRSAEAIKIEHAIGLLETQGVYFLKEYFDKMKESDKRTDQRILNDRRVVEALEIADDMTSSGKEHPKMEKLRKITKNLAGPDVKIIIFANYRSTVDKIRVILEEEGISSHEFIGQTTKDGKGMTQEEQIDVLRSFRYNAFNALIATSVGEEGLDVPSVDYAIFYEPVPSGIRSIQRRGRVGRQTAGKVIFLITKGTRDEAYHWSSFNKEKKMKKILYDMKNGKRLKREKSLLDYGKR